jgi:hypothetical protein
MKFILIADLEQQDYSYIGTNKNGVYARVRPRD